MANNIKEVLAAATQINAGADGLAASSTVGRASDVVDNTTNLYRDALVGGQVKASNSALGANPCIKLYVYALVDGTNYTDGATGSSASLTRTDPPNLIPLGTINVPAQNTTYTFGPFSVAAAFGGSLPPKWGLFVENDTGVALAGTATQDVVNKFYYVGVYDQQN